VYWGQNSCGSNYQEKSLSDVCSEKAVDMVIITYLNQFFDFNNAYKAPTLNLASLHCNATFKVKFPDLLNCSDIGKDIKTCQEKGKKVMLSLGGPNGTYGFEDLYQAGNFAVLIWQMFLGGSNASLVRPFGDAVLNGIELDIRNHRLYGYKEFVRSLRYIIDHNQNKTKYYISAKVSCADNSTELISHLLSQRSLHFITLHLYCSPCHYAGPPYDSNFTYIWSQWKSIVNNLQIQMFLGLIAKSINNCQCIDRDNTAHLLKLVSKTASFGGVMIWDSSCDGSNRVNGITYSEYISKVLNDKNK
jgi:chitinase